MHRRLYIVITCNNTIIKHSSVWYPDVLIFTVTGKFHLFFLFAWNSGARGLCPPHCYATAHRPVIYDLSKVVPCHLDISQVLWWRYSRTYLVFHAFSFHFSGNFVSAFSDPFCVHVPATAVWTSSVLFPTPRSEWTSHFVFCLSVIPSIRRCRLWSVWCEVTAAFRWFTSDKCHFNCTL